MKPAPNQFDLFDSDPGYRAVARRAPSARRNRPALAAARGDEDAVVQALEETGRFRVLRKLVPRPVIARGRTARSNGWRFWSIPRRRACSMRATR
jgi:DNA polymerase III subunit epsilon